MAAKDDACQPASLTLMGGPIDTRRNPTKVNDLAGARSLNWFEQNVISAVPFPHPGFMRINAKSFFKISVNTGEVHFIKKRQ